jgi:hypothetical protein
MVRQPRFYVLFAFVVVALFATSFNPTAPANAQGDTERRRIELKGSDKSIDVIRQLRELELVENGGKEALRVPRGAMRVRNDGAWFTPIGRGARFRDFVLHFELRLVDLPQEANGCGMVFRATSDDEYSAVMLRGDRTLELFQFENGERIVDFFESVDDLEGVDARDIEFNDETLFFITLVAIQENITFFLNGLEMITVDTAESVRGTLAQRLFNDEANDSQTACNFSNIWVWSFDN